MTKLLDALGLPPAPAPANPTTPPKQIDFKLPADPKQQVGLLADAIAKTQDAVKSDQLVKLLRDAIAKIQPLVSNAEARKQIDKLIDKGIDAAGKAALMKIIELVVGKGASQAPDPDQPHPTGPNVKEKDLGEHILKTPEIPFGKPPTAPRNSFQFRGLPKSAKAGSFVDVQVLDAGLVPPGSTRDMAHRRHGGCLQAEGPAWLRTRSSPRQQGHAQADDPPARRAGQLRRGDQGRRPRRAGARADRAQVIAQRASCAAQARWRSSGLTR